MLVGQRNVDQRDIDRMALADVERVDREAVATQLVEPHPEAVCEPHADHVGPGVGDLEVESDGPFQLFARPGGGALTTFTPRGRWSG